MRKLPECIATFSRWCAILLLCVLAERAVLAQATPELTPLDLVTRMAQAETEAARAKKHFLYRRRERSSRTRGHQWEELVLEIPAGRVRRLMSIDGHPLTQSQQAAEDARIQSLLLNPEEISRDNEGRREDEGRVNGLLQLLPRAFLFSYDGAQNGCTRVHFMPNPAYQEQSYQERVIHAAAGTLLIHPADFRLCSLDAQLQREVEFGFGLLGRVTQGSGFYMLRTQLQPDQWKTSQLRVHIDGNVLMMKSVSRQEESTHFGFVEVPAAMTVPEAISLIRSTNY